MNNETVVYGFEILAGMIVLPWCVFITANIFGLRQQLAVIRAEMGLMREIKEWLTTQKRNS